MHQVSKSQFKQTRLAWCIGITAVTMFLEAFGGWYTGSLALVSDAWHMFSHLFALGISYFAIRLSSKPADENWTFGFFRAEIIAALFNGITIFLVAFWICLEAYHRLQNPENIESSGMFIIAVIGLVVNTITAFVLHDASHDDLNVRGAFIHMLSDLISSVGVIVAACVVYYTGWTAADPIASALIAVVITIWGFGLVKDSVRILAQATPKHLSIREIEHALHQEIPELASIHRTHVWELTKGMIVLSSHLVVHDMKLSEADELRRKAKKLLHDKFDIDHSHLQMQSQ